MRLDVSLKQKQKLALTTELRQSIEILQYNHLELGKYLSDLVQENPTMDLEIKDYKIDDYYQGFQARPRSTDDEEDTSFEKYVSKEESLYDYLYEQLLFLKLNKEERRIGKLLLENIDDKGYITIDLYQFSNKYGFSFKTVLKVLDQMKNFLPLGICASSLEECLLKQAQAKGLSDLTQAIINFNLVDLAENRVGLLAEKYGVSKEEIQDSFDQIRKLNPKPGSFLNRNSRPTKFIIPDLILEINDGDLQLYENEEASISVARNPFYLDLFKTEISPEARDYLREKFKETNWIIRSLKQRRQTILQVAELLCQSQKDYLLNKGPLKPLTMSQIASKLDLHESTISRSCNGKYIQTPSRLMELKDFFTTGLESDQGLVSVDQIKLYIRTAIGAEDKKKPLSDQKITDDLNALGYKISRRTVQKYRDEMEILSSTKRKRF
ncbi:MAG: RNA polymerase factor sigma-54 [Bacillota bacterium]|nr:RNA polymerase factor sigma-54 [Bacillota bacterium]